MGCHYFYCVDSSVKRFYMGCFRTIEFLVFKECLFELVAGKELAEKYRQFNMTNGRRYTEGTFMDPLKAIDKAIWRFMYFGGDKEQVDREYCKDAYASFAKHEDAFKRQYPAQAASYGSLLNAFKCGATGELPVECDDSDGDDDWDESEGEDDKSLIEKLVEDHGMTLSKCGKVKITQQVKIELDKFLTKAKERALADGRKKVTGEDISYAVGDPIPEKKKQKLDIGVVFT